jgi:coenzyme PQQ biosynthesis protein PqqD
MNELEHHPRRAEHVLAQESAGSLVLLDSESGRYFNLDDVGARIWQLADGTRSLATIVSALAKEYDAPAETIEADAVELLAELREEGLILDVSAG